MRTYAISIQREIREILQIFLVLILGKLSDSSNVFNACDSHTLSGNFNDLQFKFNPQNLSTEWTLPKISASLWNRSEHGVWILQFLPIESLQTKDRIPSHSNHVVGPKIRKYLWNCKTNESEVQRTFLYLEVFLIPNRHIWNSQGKYLADLVFQVTFIRENQISVDSSSQNPILSSVLLRSRAITKLNPDFCFRTLYRKQHPESDSDGTNASKVSGHHDNDITRNTADYLQCFYYPPKPKRSIEDVYIGLLFAAATFLLVTVIVYVIIWDYHSLHGWTIFSEVLSNFFMILTVGLAHLYRRDPITDPPSIPCLLLAYFAHFFFLSTFCWMTIINFNLWKTFSKPCIRKRLAHFISYATFAIGVPLVFIAIGISMDTFVSSHEDVEAHVKGARETLLGKILARPNYGRKYCYISKEAQGVYIYYPIGTLIVTNVVLFGLTAFSLYKHHQETKVLHTSHAIETLSTDGIAASGSSRISNETPTQSITLFAKLFCVMGVSWISEVFAWALSKHGENVPSYWIIFDVANLVQAVAVFLIFVCKRQVLKELQRKFRNLCNRP